MGSFFLRGVTLSIGLQRGCGPESFCRVWWVAEEVKGGLHKIQQNSVDLPVKYLTSNARSGNMHSSYMRSTLGTVERTFVRLQP